MSLGEIRKVFERLPPALVAGVADGRIAVTPELVTEPSTAFRTPGMRRAALRARWGGEAEGAAESPMRMPPPPASPHFFRAPADDEEPRSLRRLRSQIDLPPAHSPSPGHGTDEDGRRGSGAVLASALRRIEEAARRRAEESPRSRNTWTRIDVSANLVLSARGIGEEDAAIVEEVRRTMRKVIR